MERPTYFWKIYATLPRAGPGSDLLTTRALKLIPSMPSRPAILDIGCGPGKQTFILARNTDGIITAIDTYQPFLDAIETKAGEGSLEDRIRPMNISMLDMPFPDSSFDIVWFEGAIFIMGFEPGLKECYRLLKKGGYAAISEGVMLMDDPPDEVVKLWREYPAVTTVENNLAMVEKAGFDLAGHFIFPPEAWWDEFYGPMEQRLVEMRERYPDVPEAQEAIAEAEFEIDVFRKYHQYYGYVFLVMRK